MPHGVASQALRKEGTHQEAEVCMLCHEMMSDTKQRGQRQEELPPTLHPRRPTGTENRNFKATEGGVLSPRSHPGATG